MHAEIKIFEDKERVAEAAARRWFEIYKESVEKSGSFFVALSGGATPRLLYRFLSRPEMAKKIDWKRVHVFFGDERSVPSDHPDSNFRMAKEALLAHVPIPRPNIFRVETEVSERREAAFRYEQRLIETLPETDDNVPQFDLVLLGVGVDGHTASLFPGTDILQQKKRFFDAVYVKQKADWRMSITFPVINHARHILFLVTGSDKKAIIQKILSPSRSGPLLPVQMISPLGQAQMYLDADAAGKIETDSVATKPNSNDPVSP